jgi:hypothetical protein
VIRSAVPLIAFAAAMILAAPDARAEEPPLARAADIEDAREVLMQWTAAYQARDYDRQWALTDPRHYRWWDRKRWRNAMAKARRKDGALTGYTIQAAAPIDAAKLPCTEIGHCYRRGIQYILFMISSTYEKAAPGQPEYVAMSKSEEGWRFGGGTFPNRPLGETAVILTEADERSYAPVVPRLH